MADVTKNFIRSLKHAELVYARCYKNLARIVDPRLLTMQEYGLIVKCQEWKDCDDAWDSLFWKRKYLESVKKGCGKNNG